MYSPWLPLSFPGSSVHLTRSCKLKDDEVATVRAAAAAVVVAAAGAAATAAAEVAIADNAESEAATAAVAVEVATVKVADPVATQGAVTAAAIIRVTTLAGEVIVIVTGTEIGTVIAIVTVTGIEIAKELGGEMTGIETEIEIGTASATAAEFMKVRVFMTPQTMGAIDIAMTPMKMAIGMACTQEQMMRGVDKATIRSAHTFSKVADLGSSRCSVAEPTNSLTAMVS